MKKTLVIASLAVLSTSAFASKARMEALNQNADHGSYYINDTRSIFLNPAELNTTKNYIITEWGNNSATDTTDAPRAEGGFFREMGTFSYGLYLGNNTSRVDHGGTFQAQTNALDLFLAGDMGLKWGARVHFANAKDEQTTAATDDKKNTAFGLGLGVVAGELSAYVNADLSDKSTGNGTTTAAVEKLKPSFNVGAAYNISGIVAFADYSNSKMEATNGTTTTTKHSTIEVGAGRIHEVNPTSRLFTNASLLLDSNDTGTGKVKQTYLPVVFGLEADATSWLVLRGSVGQNVFLTTQKAANGTKTTPTSTIVSAGATLNFGKLKVDGVIGNTGGNRGTSAAGNTTAATNANKTGVLTTDNLMTRVAVSYWF